MRSHKESYWACCGYVDQLPWSWLVSLGPQFLVQRSTTVHPELRFTVAPHTSNPPKMYVLIGSMCQMEDDPRRLSTVVPASREPPGGLPMKVATYPKHQLKGNKNQLIQLGKYGKIWETGQGFRNASLHLVFGKSGQGQWPVWVTSKFCFISNLRIQQNFTLYEIRDEELYLNWHHSR